MNVKQVIIIRKDLNMRKGKMIAQACHASLAVLLNLGQIFREHSDIDGHLMEINFDLKLYNSWLAPSGDVITDHKYILYWLENSFTKVTVYVNTEEELIELYEKAKDANIPTALIEDEGRTEFSGVPTKTCIAIGPHLSEDIDKITGHLKLL